MLFFPFRMRRSSIYILLLLFFLIPFESYSQKVSDTNSYNAMVFPKDFHKFPIVMLREWPLNMRPPREIRSNYHNRLVKQYFDKKQNDPLNEYLLLSQQELDDLPKISYPYVIKLKLFEKMVFSDVYTGMDSFIGFMFHDRRIAKDYPMAGKALQYVKPDSSFDSHNYKIDFYKERPFLKELDRVMKAKRKKDHYNFLLAENKIQKKRKRNKKAVLFSIIGAAVVIPVTTIILMNVYF